MPSPEVTMSSRALVMIGDRPIASLSGPGATQIACNTLYPAVVEDLMSRYRWRFASRIVALERMADPPLSRFDAKYQLPAGAQQSLVYSVMVNDQNIEFERFEKEVYCNAGASDLVYAEVKFSPSEAYWPQYFKALVELDLAAKLAITVAEDPSKANYFEGKALRQFALAKSLDSQTRTARKLRVGGLRRYHAGRA